MCEIKRDALVFYRSFYDAIEGLDDTTQLTLLKTIIEYGLDGTTPNLQGFMKSIFTLIKPQVDINNVRFDNGRKGGRPPKPSSNQNPKDDNLVIDHSNGSKPNNNQTVTKPEPNETEQPESESVVIDHSNGSEPNKNKNNKKNNNLKENLNLKENVSFCEFETKLEPRERDTILKIFFFDKKLKYPQNEFYRFFNHYEKLGWCNSKGIKITNAAAAARAWSAEKDAPTFSESLVAKWREVYNVIADQEGAMTLITELHDIKVVENGTKTQITFTTENPCRLLEQGFHSERGDELRQKMMVITQNTKLTYTITKQ